MLAYLVVVLPKSYVSSADGIIVPMVKNKDGKLPLHLACEVNVNIFIIESLLSCYPEAALVQDNDGNLPIHLYCIHNHSALCVKKVEKLLVNNPGTLCVQNHDRKFPSCYFDVASGEKYFTKAKKRRSSKDSQCIRCNFCSWN